jgi:D-ribose pyranase
MLGGRMKRRRLLNGPISSVVAQLGHTDTICICDAGLPVPEHVLRIDLAVSPGIPSLLDVLNAVGSEMMVEQVTIASELAETDAEMSRALNDKVSEMEHEQGRAIAVQTVSHEELKTRVVNCRAVIRSGEFTPYANIILSSGVCF